MSAEFLDSDYCYDREMTWALERHDAGEARVIPIILRPVDWHNAPFSRLQALPKDGKPVTDWPSRDRAFTDIAKGIRRAVEEIRANVGGPPPFRSWKTAGRTRPPVPPAAAATTVLPPPAEQRKGDAVLEVLQTFRDIEASWCPELVVIPPGRFTMGSPGQEKGRDADEGPQHEVRIAYHLAAGRYPVTFDEYDRFAKATGREPPGDQEWGRARRPVINVSWDDARAYVAWLSKETGKPYRLLSEAEWEYAARAGTTTPYPWGDEIAPGNANYDGNVGKTTEVGLYPPNPWGLYDMQGNVWEWVEDCWNGTYKGAPRDGTAWTRGDCSRRVLRGGSWLSNPGFLRSAIRIRDGSGDRYDNFGFRVARTLR